MRFEYAQMFSGSFEIEILDVSWMGKHMVVAVAALRIVAFAGLIVSADEWPSLVHHAKIIGREVLATGLELDVPVAFLHEDLYALMHQVPSDVVVVTTGSRLVNGKREIPTAHGRAMFTMNAAHEFRYTTR